MRESTSNMNLSMSRYVSPCLHRIHHVDFLYFTTRIATSLLSQLLQPASISLHLPSSSYLILTLRFAHRLAMMTFMAAVTGACSLFSQAGCRIACKVTLFALIHKLNSGTALFHPPFHRGYPLHNVIFSHRYGRAQNPCPTPPTIQLALPPSLSPLL
jgi:hypothetical protein